MNARALKIFYDDEVYPPSDDTYLLLSVVEVGNGEKVLEIGTGSGFIAIHCALCGANVWASDISERSIRLAQRNAEANNVRINFVKSDLFERICEKFDVIIFNPPYLPTAPDEHVHGDINLALDGGPDGNRVLERFLSQAWKFLNDSGRIYLLFSSHNLNCIKNFNEIYNWEIMARKKLFFEELYAGEFSVRMKEGLNTRSAISPQ